MKKNNTFFLVLLVVFLAIGLAFVGCGDDSDGNNNGGNNSGGTNSGGNNSSSGNTILNTPTNVSATTASSSSITVSWYSVTDASEYYIFRSSSLSGTYSLVGSSTSTSYTDTGLSASTTYYYKVAAYNSAGTGSQSSYASATTSSSSSGGSGTIKPGTPTDFYVYSSVSPYVTSSSIKMDWDAVTGATGYYVYRSSSAYGTYTKVGNSTSTSYTDTGLSAGTTYYYKVSAYNSAGESSLSAYDYSTTSPSSSGGGTSVPSAPTGVTATRQSASNVYITWNSVSGATSYKVYWSYTASGTYSLAGTTTSTNYTDTGWGASESGYIKVSAVNSAGEGAQSSYASFSAYSSGGGSTSWPPTVAGTFDGSSTKTTPQSFTGTLSSTSSVLWYKISWPLSYSEISIMGLDRQGSSSYTADIVASFYGSSGSLLEGPTNIGYLGSIDRGVSSLSTYYIKVEVNPSSPYTGTFMISLLLK